jgi:hypothetical protein
MQASASSHQEWAAVLYHAHRPSAPHVAVDHHRADVCAAEKFLDRANAIPARFYRTPFDCTLHPNLVREDLPLFGKEGRGEIFSIDIHSILIPLINRNNGHHSRESCPRMLEAGSGNQNSTGFPRIKYGAGL